LHKADINKMRELLDIDWPSYLGNNDVNTMCNSFMKIFDKVISECVPKRKLRKHRPILFSPATVACIKRKRRLWTRYIETKSDYKYREFCKARNKVKKLVRNECKKREKYIASISKSNCKPFWNYINSKRKVKSGISELVYDGITSDTDDGKANVLGKFFSSVFIVDDINTCIADLNVVVTPQADIGEISKEEIIKLLRSLNPSKSPGPDGVHPKILRDLANELSTPIQIIFNKSLNSGVVPDMWKEAIITAIFKKGDKSSPSNYRPVSLTSILCKTIEKIVKNHIVAHMKLNNLFSNRQFGFMEGRSTSLQLLNVLDDWVKVLDEGGVIHAIYMDFMKAFDTVSHQRLLFQLKNYGINTKICEWVKSFLTGRKQAVKINSSISEWHEVTSGIPQGSVLGPILFVIFINDLPDCVNSSPYMFADDTKIYREIRSINDRNMLQNDLDKLFNWSCNSRLKFHPGKCKVLEISSKYTQQQVKPQYVLQDYNGNSVPLGVASHEKDIGVIFESSLNFSMHIQSKVSKANQIVGLIRRSFINLTESIFVFLFKSLVRPHLEYANSVWNPFHKKEIDSLENVQRRATKMLPNLKELSYPDRLRKLKLPSLRYRRLRGDMIETFKIVHGYFDPIVAKGLIHLSDNHITRGNQFKLLKRRSRLDICKYSFSHRIVDIWNNLPDSVVNATSINCFKNRLDRFWSNQPLLYDFNSSYVFITNTGSRNKFEVDLKKEAI